MSAVVLPFPAPAGMVLPAPADLAFALREDEVPGPIAFQIGQTNEAWAATYLPWVRIAERLVTISRRQLEDLLRDGTVAPATIAADLVCAADELRTLAEVMNYAEARLRAAHVLHALQRTQTGEGDR